MSALFENFSQHISLAPREWDSVLELAEQRTVKKKELILNQGKYCRNIYFVEKGSFRAYHLNEAGKDATIMFALQNWWITDMYSFAKETPALQNIVALEDSTVFAFEKQRLDELAIKLPKLNFFFKVLYQNAYIREQLRAMDAITLSTEERYLKFKDSYPQLLEAITQKQIASYLGVTPEFLSAIKRRS